MSDWSWKQAVAERVLQIVNRDETMSFSLKDLYKQLGDFKVLFPRNRHVREKIRQVLQQLRDDGFLAFEGSGLYTLNLAYEELEAEPVPLHARGIESPITKQVVRNIRLRNTLLGAEIKRRYDNTCQVCRIPVPLGFSRYYAEAHHLWPLGSPHFGPDVSENIIIVCPNHHVMLDGAALTVVPDTLRLRHAVKGLFKKDAHLYVAPWHCLNPKYLEYHYRIFQTRLSLSDSTPAS